MTNAEILRLVKRGGVDATGPRIVLRPRTGTAETTVKSAVDSLVRAGIDRSLIRVERSDTPPPPPGQPD